MKIYLINQWVNIIGGFDFIGITMAERESILSRYTHSGEKALQIVFVLMGIGLIFEFPPVSKQ